MRRGGVQHLLHTVHDIRQQVVQQRHAFRLRLLRVLCQLTGRHKEVNEVAADPTHLAGLLGLQLEPAEHVEGGAEVFGNLSVSRTHF